MPLRNILALGLTLISLGMLIPGLSQPIMHMSADAKVTSQMAELQTNVLNKSRSILGTAEDLFAMNNQLVAGLIVLFCIVIPVMKSLLLVVAIALPRISTKVARILDAISKWSMADVFLVAILLTWLATSEQREQASQNLSFFGMKIPVELGLHIQTAFGPGFWWFLGYCLLSIAAIQMADIREQAAQ